MRKLSPLTVLAGLIGAGSLGACGSTDDRELTAASQVSGILTLTTLPGGGDESGGDSGTAGGSETDGAAESGASDPTSTSDPGGVKFDLGVTPDAGPEDVDPEPCNNPNDPGCKCSIPEHTPCDNGTQDPFRAMGLNCPGELQVQTSTYGSPNGIGVRYVFGQGGTFNPREGATYAVIGSGRVAELDNQTPVFNFDPGNNLPAPLRTNNVGGDCSVNPALLGTGDCSNTIQGQFQNYGANDYTELRFVLQVPPDVTSFSYDFAFFSTEYPFYYKSPYNDMYIGWLESEQWTGNISFDQQGNPISLNAGFLEFTDDPTGQNPIPQFQNTCMRQHAGTNWLQTTAGVTPGETITVVFAIMDISDSILDSYVFLDNFRWGCEPTGKPTTEPPG
jgi:hypothetical protein